MKGKIILCLCLVVCLTVLGVSGFMVWNNYAQRQDNQEEFAELSRQTTVSATNDEATTGPETGMVDVDAAARDYITEQGYGDKFVHRTGHSIGQDVHEFGDVSSVNTEVLKPGMVFSIEPGIYLAGDFGVRIEDLVLVSEDGCKVLNGYTKELQVI